ncbi:hypothetical protein [Streptomyces albidoflavus]|uniref:hypothetical protein n=1 Tax=Streptomyces albidoflavus TaxID=1886 RepID=UPI0033F7CEAA
MRIRTTTVGLLLAALATSCTTPEAPDNKPTPAATTTEPSSTPTVDAFEECAAAIAKDVENQNPPKCDTLSNEDYLDANMEGLRRHNQANLDERAANREREAARD